MIVLVVLLLPRGLVWLFGLRGGVRTWLERVDGVQGVSAQSAEPASPCASASVGMRFGGLWALDEVSASTCERGSGASA